MTWLNLPIIILTGLWKNSTNQPSPEP